LTGVRLVYLRRWPLNAKTPANAKKIENSSKIS